MTDHALRYKIGLSLINGIGPLTAKKIIAYVGGVEALFHEKKKNLMRIDGIGEYLASNIVNQNVLERADQEIEFITKNNITSYFYLDKEYPFRLKQCADAPLMLFSKGNSLTEKRKIISIVGTRNATEYGKSVCTNIIDEINKKGHDVSIVSGLAYGIDIVAHRTALKNNLSTIAVLGHSLDRIYPWSHKNTSEEILNDGTLVSEFLSGTVPDRQNFVKRNRIIAGLSDATIVVESGVKGGSLITADIANSYDRDVFAFPGRVNDSYSSGCNYLIKTNRASLIESVGDLEYLLGWESEEKKKPGVEQQKLFSDLSDDEQMIVDLIREYGELHIDLISMKSKITQGQVSAILLTLEFAGFIKTLPGKVYKLI